MCTEYFAQTITEIFQVNTSYRSIIKAMNSSFPKLGQGSGRAVYCLGPNLVVKVARNEKGLAQNEEEINLLRYGDFDSVCPNIINYASNYKWLIMEKVKPLTIKKFKTFFGDFDTFRDLLWAVGSRQWADFDRLKNTFDEYITDSLQEFHNYGILVGDFNNIKNIGYREIDGIKTLIFLDMGFSENVKKSYY